MSSTTKTRLYLLLIAILPSLLIVSVIYFYSIKQYEQLGGEKTYESLNHFNELYNSYLNDLSSKAIELSQSDDIKRAVLLIKSNRKQQVDLSSSRKIFDIIEIVDSNYIVQASAHRPGLIGEVIKVPNISNNSDSTQYFENIEYDMNGRFAVLGFLVPIENNYYLYLSKYIDSNLILLTGQLLQADIELLFAEDSEPDYTKYVNLSKGGLFHMANQDSLVAILSGSKQSKYILLAKFDIAEQKPIFFSLLRITGVVALASVLLAILVGIYITGQTKKEIVNLIDATQKVSEGDLSTPVMAYQEGEFSQLADSFTEMKSKLQKTLDDLSTTEKIAAWKEMGQKIAHEVKNPLTPIAISIDDLRRSYYEKLPDFDKTIDETTTVIKIEINRLIKLLDQFVKFARMEPPKIVETEIKSIVESIASLYQQNIDSGNLKITNSSNHTNAKLDGEKIKQLLINLIKNGLESSPETKVNVTFADTNDGLLICLDDTGPGFPQEIIDSHFKPYSSTKKDGSGLGLVISARIVHDHGGTITIFNKEEEGGRVEINLPL
ncbi:MAG: HAMP domain-containing protein [candidate division Zixibacteria bacterium]|nr:HAMP domain-containing protein [candidate division Zixibacteria bacterium]